MYQVNFSEQSMSVLNKLEKWDQMPLIEKLCSLTAKDLKENEEDLGRFQRDGKSLYRLRVGEYRIYFEEQVETLYVHYFLSQHSLTDFLFRFKFPLTDEQIVEQHQSFWKYLDTLKK
jgi:mRNA interferase RelE/StbE